MAKQFELSKEQCGHLETMNGKFRHLKDAVKGVALGYHTGLFLFGEGGTSKSYTVTQTLKELKANYLLHNSRLTARGLVESLEKLPKIIHWIEDAETLMEDKKSFGVLRSALWSQSKEKPMVRPVSWRANQTDINFDFTGGIIVISNQNLAESIPEIRAIKTRINVLEMNISNEETEALMQQIANSGYEFGDEFLSPEECRTVKDFIVEQLTQKNRRLDLRLMQNGFRDFLQARAGHSELTWQELIEGRMAERISYKSRADQNQEKHLIASRIHLAAKKNGWSWARTVAEAKTVGFSAAGYARALKRG